MQMVDAINVVEPNVWFVVFHRKSLNRVLSFLAFGEFKHVSAIGYCPGVKLWLIYDVQWAGTRTMLADEPAIIQMTRDCALVRIERTGEHMGLSGRLGLYCVTAVKHLIGLRCVAMTPTQLYRHILRHGGVPIDGRRRQCTGTNT